MALALVKQDAYDSYLSAVFFVGTHRVVLTEKQRKVLFPDDSQ